MRQWTFETFRLRLVAIVFSTELRMLTRFQYVLPKYALSATSSVCLADALYIEHLYGDIPQELVALRSSAITRLLDLVEEQNKKHPDDDKTNHEEMLRLWLAIELEFNEIMEKINEL